MKICIDREPLLTALTRMSGVVKRSGTIAILQHVMLDAGDGTCRLTCTNLDIQASIAVPCSVATPGATTLSAERLREICSRLPDGAQIEIDATDPLRASVKAGRSKFSVGALPAKDFPLLTPIQGGETLEMEAGKLLRLLAVGSACMGAISPCNCCYVVTAAQGELRAISTDRAAMAMISAPSGGLHMPDGVTIGAETVGIILRALKTMSETEMALMTILPGKMLSATLGGTSLVSRVIDGKFLPYERVIPAKTDVAFTVDARTLAGMLDRARITSSYVDLLVSAADGLSAQARNQEAGDSSDETLDIEWAGTDRRICIKAEQVLGLLEHVQTEDVIIQSDEADMPIRIYETGSPDWVAVYMPLRGSR